MRDFGTYAGDQSLTLTPDSNRNVILIGGKNGVVRAVDIGNCYPTLLLREIRLAILDPTGQV